MSSAAKRPGRLAQGALSIVKEAARHVLRRPVVGVAATAHTDDDRWLLIRRADSGSWALPGGTLEWGETLATAIIRELREEAGVEEARIGRLVGVYSDPDRDPRFHAVTAVVEVVVEPPRLAPVNPLEIREAKLFARDELPPGLSHGNADMIADAFEGHTRFE